MKAGFAAMRLGSVIYILPFFFVLEPALIGRGDPIEVATVVVLAMVGIWLIASALQGYLMGYGAFADGAVGIAARLGLGMGGIIVAMPGSLVPGFSHVQLAALGLCVSGSSVAGAWMLGQGRATRL